jgi:hypothetical protein
MPALHLDRLIFRIYMGALLKITSDSRQTSGGVMQKHSGLLVVAGVSGSSGA